MEKVASPHCVRSCHTFRKAESVGGLERQRQNSYLSTKRGPRMKEVFPLTPIFSRTFFTNDASFFPHFSRSEKCKTASSATRRRYTHIFAKRYGSADGHRAVGFAASPTRTVLVRCSALSASNGDTTFRRRSHPVARELFAESELAMFFWRGGSGEDRFLFKKRSSSRAVSFLRESPPCQKPVEGCERRHHV